MQRFVTKQEVGSLPILRCSTPAVSLSSFGWRFSWEATRAAEGPRLGAAPARSRTRAAQVTQPHSSGRSRFQHALLALHRENRRKPPAARPGPARRRRLHPRVPGGAAPPAERPVPTARCPGRPPQHPVSAAVGTARRRRSSVPALPKRRAIAEAGKEQQRSACRAGTPCAATKGAAPGAALSSSSAFPVCKGGRRRSFRSVGA